jgi:hypothetical protein
MIRMPEAGALFQPKLHPPGNTAAPLGVPPQHQCLSHMSVKKSSILH